LVIVLVAPHSLKQHLVNTAGGFDTLKIGFHVTFESRDVN
jgi:hypothetical protein